jgi:hypothetical protein
VYIPEALARTYLKAARETSGQWVFPARARSLDPRSGRWRLLSITRATSRRAIGCRTVLSYEVSTVEHRPWKRPDDVYDAIPLKHASIRTGASYVTCMTRDMLFHNERRIIAGIGNGLTADDLGGEPSVSP